MYLVLVLVPVLILVLVLVRVLVLVLLLVLVLVLVFVLVLVAVLVPALARGYPGAMAYEMLIPQYSGSRRLQCGLDTKGSTYLNVIPQMFWPKIRCFPNHTIPSGLIPSRT